MVEKIVAADVQDESPFGPKAADVMEVLFRPDPDVNAARRLQIRDHLYVGGLVRDQVVGIEIAALFRELLHELSKPGNGSRRPGAGGGERTEGEN
jgi:hypothetical protein